MGAVIHACLPREVARVTPRIFHTCATDADLQMRIVISGMSSSGQKGIAE